MIETAKAKGGLEARRPMRWRYRDGNLGIDWISRNSFNKKVCREEMRSRGDNPGGTTEAIIVVRIAGG
jgi:hypothetical protein